MFKIGDRVKHIGTSNKFDREIIDNKLFGLGTIVATSTKEPHRFLIDFDNSTTTGGHVYRKEFDICVSEGDTAEEEHGFYLSADDIIPNPFKYEVGERAFFDNSTLSGAGTIVAIKDDGELPYLFRFDDESKGIHGGGCKDLWNVISGDFSNRSDCIWTADKDLSPFYNINISFEGPTTVATLYRGDVVEKSAIARCSPQDRFDYLTGAKLALERLSDIEYTFEGYKRGDFAVNCTTERDAEMFCMYLHGKGEKWRNGDSYSDITEWNIYKEKTCYTSYGMYINSSFCKLPIIKFTKEML